MNYENIIQKNFMGYMARDYCLAKDCTCEYRIGFKRKENCGIKDTPKCHAYVALFRLTMDSYE